MKRDRQKDPSPGLSDQRRRRSTSQKARILDPIVKMVADQFPYQNSLGHQELIVVKYLVLYHKIVFMQIVNYSQLCFYDQRILFRFVILCYILCCLSRSWLSLWLIGVRREIDIEFYWFKIAQSLDVWQTLLNEEDTYELHCSFILTWSVYSTQFHLICSSLTAWNNSSIWRGDIKEMV